VNGINPKAWLEVPAGQGHAIYDMITTYLALEGHQIAVYFGANFDIPIIRASLQREGAPGCDLLCNRFEAQRFVDVKLICTYLFPSTVRTCGSLVDIASHRQVRTPATGHAHQAGYDAELAVALLQSLLPEIHSIDLDSSAARLTRTGVKKPLLDKVLPMLALVHPTHTRLYSSTPHLPHSQIQESIQSDVPN
jgi:DNA polymerase III epsilon subunit-like protein